MNIVSASELRRITKRSDLISFFNRVVSQAASQGGTACAVELVNADGEDYDFLLNELDSNGFLYELYYCGSGASEPAGVVVCWDNDSCSLNDIFMNNENVCRE